MRVVMPCLLLGCANAPTTETTPVQPVPETFALTNTGNADQEGHTPRGFQGQGGGLFVGDNLNPGFPDGDGVQMFLSVNLGMTDLGQGRWTVESAVLASAVEPEIAGTPFADLGDLIAEEVMFDAFSSDLWDLPLPDDADSCVFATGPQGAFSCDLTAGLQRAIDARQRRFNVRLRFEDAGDNDGSQDMVFFYVDDRNATAPGIFSLDVVAADAE